MLADLAPILVKKLKSTESEVNSYLYANLEMYMVETSTVPLTKSFVEVKDGPGSRLSTPGKKPTKAPQANMTGRTKDLYDALRKLWKAEKRDR